MIFVCRIALIGIFAVGLRENYLIADDDDDDQLPRLPGLRASFQSGNPVVHRIDDRLAFWFDQDQTPSKSVDPAQWNAEWSGMLETRLPGKYRFFAIVSGRFELTIDGRQVLIADSGDSSQSVKQTGEEIELPYGSQSIHGRFSKFPDRPARLRLFRQLPDGFEESVLPSAFRIAHETPPRESRSVEPEDRPSQLISEKRCGLCHQASEELSRKLAFEVRHAASLSDLARGLRPAWIRSWIRTHQTRSMNGILKLFGDGETAELDLKVVEIYLSTLATEQAASANASQPDSAQSGEASNHDQARGQELFARIGCIACHLAPTEQTVQETRLIPLENLSQKYLPEQLFARLIGPTDHKATAGHQPKLDLQDMATSDVQAIELFLLGQKTSSETGALIAKSDISNLSAQQLTDRFHSITDDSTERSTFEGENELQRVIRLGRHLVRKRGCLNCHRDGDESVASMKSLDDILQTPAQNILDKGCLSKAGGAGIPDYNLTDDERAAIGRELVTVIDSKIISDAPLERLEAELKRLRCTSCHERGGRTAEFGQRIGTFVSLGRDKTLRDIAPPSLDGVGERLTKRWLKNVLVEHSRSRRWLDVKMPRYDAHAVERLIDLLIRSDGLDPEESVAAVPDTGVQKLDGARLLIGRTGLNCVGCHDFGDHRATGVRAPDLATATERLRFDWFRRWLHDPQAIAPGTRMPSAFQSGISALPKVLGGREDVQVPALWAYLGKTEGREPPLLPTIWKNADVNLEPDSPRPTDRPILRHGFLPDDAGLKAIALGFPEGLHFAWDSVSCRLTRAWSGAFIHHAGWEGSGKGDVSANAMSIMGEVIWRDDDDRTIQFARTSGEEILVGSSDCKFDECWTTRSSGGFTWHIQIEGRLVRLAAHLKPLPAFGKYAFRRNVTVENLPEGIDVSHRVDSGNIADRNLAGSGPLEWIRINHGRHDWLILSNASSQPTNLIAREGVQKKRFGKMAASTDVWMTVPASDERDRIVFDLVYVRVDQGASLPDNWQGLLRLEGDLH